MPLIRSRPSHFVFAQDAQVKSPPATVKRKKGKKKKGPFILKPLENGLLKIRAGQTIKVYENPYGETPMSSLPSIGHRSTERSHKSLPRNLPRSERKKLAPQRMANFSTDEDD